MLGHASAAITLDIYSHAISDTQQDTAGAMAQVQKKNWQALPRRHVWLAKRN
jgi:hypothetical protein